MTHNELYEKLAEIYELAINDCFETMVDKLGELLVTEFPQQWEKDQAED